MSYKTVRRDLFEQFARIGKALANAKRLQILELLAQSARNVDGLAKLTGLSIASTSQHLQQLRQAGLVEASKEGLYVFYRLAGDRIVNLLAALNAVGEAHLAEVDALVKLYLNGKDHLEPVRADELLHRIERGLAIVLDVRPPEEFAAGHISGAVNMSVAQIEKRLRELPKGGEIVAYCRGPYCLLAFDAVAELRKRGRRARRLEHGFPEWRSAGLPVETGFPVVPNAELLARAAKST
jgi:DNA-binding transcriptional ArsR family regulator